MNTSKLRAIGLCEGNSPVTGFHLMTSSCVVNRIGTRWKADDADNGHTMDFVLNENLHQHQCDNPL